MEHRKVSHDFVIMSQWCDGCHVTVTVCHMTRVTWGPWESKRIATVVKCISSRELSENSIKFSLSNSKQRDSWLNSGHWTLDTDTVAIILMILFCVRINAQISKAKYIRTHTQRHCQHSCIYHQDVLYSPSNHREGVALWKLSWDICQILSQT